LKLQAHRLGLARAHLRTQRQHRLHQGLAVVGDLHARGELAQVLVYPLTLAQSQRAPHRLVDKPRKALAREGQRLLATQTTISRARATALLLDLCSGPPSSTPLLGLTRLTKLALSTSLARIRYLLLLRLGDRRPNKHQSTDQRQR